MTDPTTRDPAASLARCIELAAKATPGEWEATTRSFYDGPLWDVAMGDDPNNSAGCGYDDDECNGRANAEAIAAAVNFLRDDAPALLAEVGRLKFDLQQARGWNGDPKVTGETAIANANAAGAAWQARAEAAEQVAREAVDLLRAVRRPTWGMSTSNWFDARDTFLAHHGARTGESNEA